MVTIKPIRDDEGHRKALAQVDQLWGADVGTPDGDALEVLAILIDEYERRRWPVERIDPIDALKAHMDMHGLSRADLVTLFGSEPRASEILHRRRRLTVDMIARLTNEWGIPADWLVQPYDLAIKTEANPARTEKRIRRHPMPLDPRKQRFEAGTQRGEVTPPPSSARRNGSA